MSPRLVAKIDEQGVFVEDVVLEDDEPTPEGCVEARPPEGFYIPLWTGSEWAEGRPQAELLEQAKTVKRREFPAAFAAECAVDFTSPWAAVAVLASDPRDVRIAALKTRAGKLKDKLAAVESAATIEAVRAVSW